MVKKHKGFRLTPEVINKLEDVCKQMDRSMSWYVNNLLEINLNIKNNHVVLEKKQIRKLVIPESELIKAKEDLDKVYYEIEMNKLLSKSKDIVTPIIQDIPQANKTIDDIELPKSLINEITKAYEGMTNSDQLIANAIKRAKEKIGEKVCDPKNNLL